MGYFVFKGDVEVYVDDTEPQKEIKISPQRKKKIVFNKDNVAKCPFCGFATAKKYMDKHMAAKHGTEP